jgi:hypothetical protein
MTYTLLMITSATIIHIILHFNLERDAQKHEEQLKFHLPKEEDQFL